MALFRHTSAHHHTVGTFLERVHDKERADASAARHLDKFDIFWQLMLNPFLVCTACQAVLALEKNDLRFASHAASVTAFSDSQLFKESITISSVYASFSSIEFDLHTEEHKPQAMQCVLSTSAIVIPFPRLGTSFSTSFTAS
jgi:hypothetical protein